MVRRGYKVNVHEIIYPVFVSVVDQIDHLHVEIDNMLTNDTLEGTIVSNKIQSA
jgi:hypothetical protein